MQLTLKKCVYKHIVYYKKLKFQTSISFIETLAIFTNTCGNLKFNYPQQWYIPDDLWGKSIIWSHQVWCSDV